MALTLKISQLKKFQSPSFHLEGYLSAYKVTPQLGWPIMFPIICFHMYYQLQKLNHVKMPTFPCKMAVLHGFSQTDICRN